MAHYQKTVFSGLFIFLALTLAGTAFSQTQPQDHEKDNTVCTNVNGKEVCETIVDTSAKPVASMDVAHGASTPVAQAPEPASISKVTIMPGAVSDNNSDNTVQSGPIYKYQDTSGQWVYSDSPPKSKQGKHSNVTKLDLN
jgi:hypothetical protein